MRFPLQCIPLLMALLAGCAAPPSAVDPGVLARDLERALARAERRGFAGQLVVVHGDVVLVKRGFGTMTPSGQRPVDGEAVMPLASVTKPITASAVLRLAGQGRISLDDPIGQHLPGLGEQWVDIPIRHVLTHTAGLPGEIVDRDYDGTPRFEPVDRQSFIERVNRFHPDAPPGESFDYSNVGYGVLAALIETVSGRSFERFVAAELLEPAGIDGIGLLEPGWPPGRLVTSRDGTASSGHYFDQPMLSDGAGFHLRGAGDLMATPGGVIDWWCAIREGRWLPESPMAQWLVPRVADPDGGAYGYGWHFRNGRPEREIGHTGQALDFTVAMTWYPDRDLLVYINSANARFRADELVEVP